MTERTSKTGRDEYAQLAKPGVFARLLSCGLDVEYHRARGDYLYCREADDPRTGRAGHSEGGASESDARPPSDRPAAAPGPDAGEIEILDLVGGFGAGLLGHNHPEVLQTVRELATQERPFLAQGSVRGAAGKLAAELSRRAEREVGEHHADGVPRKAPGERGYVVTLTNSGTEAVEAALKHAALERRRKLERLADEAARADASGAGSGTERAAALRELALAPPQFLALSRGFHGKTTGALQMTRAPEYREPWATLGVRVREIPAEDAAALAQAVDDATVSIPPAEPSSGGGRGADARFVDIAAIFVEPIQGEGGVFSLSTDYLAALRRAADEGDFPLVVDEIQTGMGRAGRFFAASESGLRGDYVLLAKALGGGVAKIGALLVRRDRYAAEFGRLHSSTFAEDDWASEVALTALSVIERDDIPGRASRLGERLLSRLRDVAERYPDAIAAVRGRGLMVGVEIADMSGSASPLIRVLAGAEQLGFVLAGYFLHRDHIRIFPTLSAPRTLRIEPSAYIAFDELERFAVALERACAALRAGDVYELCAFLARPGPGFSRDRHREPPGALRGAEVGPAQSSPPPRDLGKARDARRIRARPAEHTEKVGFLAHFLEPGDLRRWEPGLSPLSDEACERFLRRAREGIPPFVVGRSDMRSPAGTAAELTVVGLPFTPSQVMASLRSGEADWALELVARGTELAAGEGCRIIGFGGYTSIVTGNCRDVRPPPGVAVTSGNSLTAAAALEAVFEEARRRGRRRLRLAVVGAAGNIGAALAEVAGEEVDELVLVGRSRARRRLDALKRALDGRVRARIEVSTELGDLAGCDAILTATNAPSPIILPEHVGTGGVIVCDVATPGDVDPTVQRARPDASVLSGGRVRAPLGQKLAIDGFDLEPGEIYGCLAETLLLGLSGLHESLSRGPLRADRVRHIRELAKEHGFSLGAKP